MATLTARNRLLRDLQRLASDPLPGITAVPLEDNILEWHYAVRGSLDTPYEGGIYHGKLIFPPEFPFKPPAIYMLTPSGRFKPNERLCLSISDFHPEQWNPGWSVSTILLGLQSFMNDNEPTAGAVRTSFQVRKILAKESKNFNLKDKNFCKLFPDLAQELRAEVAQEGESSTSAAMTEAEQAEYDEAVNDQGPRARVRDARDFIQRVPRFALGLPRAPPPRRQNADFYNGYHAPQHQERLAAGAGRRIGGGPGPAAFDANNRAGRLALDRAANRNQMRERDVGHPFALDFEEVIRRHNYEEAEFFRMQADIDDRLERQRQEHFDLLFGNLPAARPIPDPIEAQMGFMNMAGGAVPPFMGIYLEGPLDRAGPLPPVANYQQLMERREVMGRRRPREGEDDYAFMARRPFPPAAMEPARRDNFLEDDGQLEEQDRGDAATDVAVVAGDDVADLSDLDD